MNSIAGTTGDLEVLLVEDNPPDARFVRMALTSGVAAKVHIIEVARLDDAVQALEAQRFDVVLLDLGLPDSRGLVTFSSLHARIRSVPVVVLSALADETTMLDAVRLGAQDYLVKGEFNAALLVRVMRHAMERHQMLQQLERSLSYVRALLQEIEGSAYPGEPNGMLAMCAWCKRLRVTPSRWETIEEYLVPRAQAQLTHAACPVCVKQIKQRVGDDELPSR